MEKKHENDFKFKLIMQYKCIIYNAYNNNLQKKII